MNDLRNTQYIHTMLKEVLSSIKHGKPFNILGVLEILNSSRDVDMQVKLLSILSAYLMLNDPNIEAIVTYHPLYDKICNILANCPPKKTTVTFNFLSALLYVNEEDGVRKKNLVEYARNMMRSSGCLATLCDLFTTSMMNQDAWRALCRCLAETCRGIEENQSYCTHLVPMCVQRCSQRNIEILLVLQSLLQNHSRNISLFLGCNGISLFQRDFLQLDVCLQVLATVVQGSAEAVALIAKTNIVKQLRDFLHLYGPQSQLGQWATIVLYHTSKGEASEGNNNVYKEKINRLNKSSLETMDQNRDCSTDTTKFFQNVMKEIIQSGAQKEFKRAQHLFSTNINDRSQRNIINDNPNRSPFYDMTQNNKLPIHTSTGNKSYSRFNNQKLTLNESLHYTNPNELSFSFLRQQNLANKNVTTRYVTEKTEKIDQTCQRIQDTHRNITKNNTVYDSVTQEDGSYLSTTDTVDFSPMFASTPKKRADKSRKNNTLCSNNNTRRHTQLLIRKPHTKRRKENKRNVDMKSTVKEIKHRTISGRFFDAINESCTTLVKTVKNIFRPKSQLHETKDSLYMSSANDALSCSYSFTNYMRRRDAMFNESAGNTNDVIVESKLKDECEDFSVEMSNACNTCNDTISLKCKLANDGHLKQTIRKLKQGINLYGCDFKKISRSMWPKETYMTPAVLYNLYRKLIIK